jgi:hypothetical protein
MPYTHTHTFPTPQDVRDSPLLAQQFDTLAADLFMVVINGTEKRLSAIVLHTMTAKRLKVRCAE